LPEEFASACCDCLQRCADKIEEYEYDGAQAVLSWLLSLSDLQANSAGVRVVSARLRAALDDGMLTPNDAGPVLNRESYHARRIRELAAEIASLKERATG